MAKKIKVLMLVPSLRVGSGVSSFAIAYFRKLDHSCVQMDFACYYYREQSYAEEIEKAGSTVFYLPSVRHFKKHLAECRRILRGGQYDIIHDCSLVNTIPFMMAAKKFVPHRILHSHSSRLGETPFKALRNWLFVPLLRSCANEYAACFDLAARALFGKKDYALIPNVIEVGKFDFNEKTREKIRGEMKAEEKLIVGSAGRGAPQKKTSGLYQYSGRCFVFAPMRNTGGRGAGLCFL